MTPFSTHSARSRTLAGNGSPGPPRDTAEPPRDQTQPRQGRVRWRVFAAVLVPSVLAIGGMMVATAGGALGVSFAISGKPFTVTASKLSGTGFEQFGTFQSTAAGHQSPVFVNAISSASLANLCQSVSIGNGVFLKITAGDGGTPASAQSLVVDNTALTGQAQFNHISIGQDAGTLNAVGGVNGPSGTFGQQADRVTIDNLRQTALSTTAGTFTLPGMRLSLSSSGC